jgi:hypothetical protein
MQEKAEVDRKIDQEERKAAQEKEETRHKDFLANLDTEKQPKKICWPGWTPTRPRWRPAIKNC